LRGRKRELLGSTLSHGRLPLKGRQKGFPNWRMRRMFMPQRVKYSFSLPFLLLFICS